VGEGSGGEPQKAGGHCWRRLGFAGAEGFGGSGGGGGGGGRGGVFIRYRKWEKVEARSLRPLRLGSWLVGGGARLSLTPGALPGRRRLRRIRRQGKVG
jgi:hypothetical protein